MNDNTLDLMITKWAKNDKTSNSGTFGSNRGMKRIPSDLTKLSLIKG